MTAWRRVECQACDLCPRSAIWCRPDGSLRCASCPRPEAPAYSPIASSRVVSEPGAAIEVTEYTLTPEARAGLNIGSAAQMPRDEHVTGRTMQDMAGNLVFVPDPPEAADSSSVAVYPTCPWRSEWTTGPDEATTVFACRLDVGHIDGHRAGCGDWNSDLQFTSDPKVKP